MTWPASDVNTTNVDSDADSPLSARPDFSDLMTKFNQMRNHVSSFIQGLLDDANAATARGTLGSGTIGDALFVETTASGGRGTLGVTATGADTTYAFRSNNLSDLGSASTARSNLGLGSCALQTTSTLTLDGPLDITNAAAGQIKFPAAQNASSGANTLDDYEEGTWTFGIDSTGPTYGFRAGDYVKIGASVYCQGTMTLTNKGTGTFSAITGLPFTLAGGTAGVTPLQINFVNLTTALITMPGEILSGNAIQVYKQTAAATTSYTGIALADISNSTRLRVAFTSTV